MNSGGRIMSVLDDNIAKLEGLLARFKDGGIQNRIAGQDGRSLWHFSDQLSGR